MNNQIYDSELYDLITVLHSDVTSRTLPDAYREAALKLLLPETDEGMDRLKRLPRLIDELYGNEQSTQYIQPSNIQRLIKDKGLTALANDELAAVFSSSKHLEAVLSMLYPDNLGTKIN